MGSIDKFGRSKSVCSSIKNRGPPGIGFRMTTDNQFNIEGRRLCNVSEPINKFDAVNKSYIDEVVINLADEVRKSVRVTVFYEIEKVNKKMDEMFKSYKTSVSEH